MICDLLVDRPNPERRTDVCIVGAGAAGITLAVELVRLGRTVALLEGGGAELEDASQTPYASEIAGLPHRGVEGGRFRALGGTTTKWGGQILKLQPIDLERREWIPESGWPISVEELEPFYRRALELEGVSGSLEADEEVWRAIGQPETPDFGELRSYLSRWCPEPNFAKLHQRTLERSPRLQTWLHANAIDLVIKEDVIEGVCCRSLGGEAVVFRAQTYIFALGAIESSRFFLQPRECGLPWNRSGLLGCHFQDHIDADVAAVVPLNLKEFRNAFDTIFLSGYKYTPKLSLTEAAQREFQLLNVGGTIYSGEKQTEISEERKAVAKAILKGRLGDITPAQYSLLARSTPTLLRQAHRYLVAHRGWHPKSASFRLRVHCEQEPTSDGRITLGKERDALGLLRTRLDWRISTTEMQSIRSFVDIAKRSLKHIARVEAHPELADERDGFRAQCEDSYHHMGGMRMHAASSQGVVDTDLRLHGMQNGYVCSSAAFPTSGFSNPTHTLLALAVRLARHLAS